MKKIPNSFRDWKETDLLLSFGLRPKEKCVVLEDWLASSKEILEYESVLLDILRRKAAKYVHTWNEAELRDNFISPLVTLIDFNDSTIGMKAFSERDIGTVINKISLKGRVEWMVAFGIDEPIIPFFFLHEYKSASPSSQVGTGIGQVLASMVVAQNLNQNPPVTPIPNIIPKMDKDMPVYGCYVNGRNWTFLVLEDKGYCLSQSFDCTEEKDLTRIVQVLKGQRAMIVERLSGK